MLCSALQGMSMNSTQSSFRCGSRLQQQARPRPTLPAPGTLHIEAAHKKGGGSTKNGRDSKAKRRGVKVYGGQPVKAGGIIVRQVGATFHAGVGTALGKDYTLFALSEGIVEFKKSKYNNRVNIIPFAEYQVPEGNQVKEGSRKSRKREQYPPRAQMREQLQSPVPAATS